jgi:hypothetical protein
MPKNMIDMVDVSSFSLAVAIIRHNEHGAVRAIIGAVQSA